MPPPPLFCERLWPPWWAWPLAAGAPAMLGVAYGYAVAPWVGWLVCASVAAIVALAMVSTAPVIKVTNAGLLAKRAFLGSEYLGTATTLDREEAKLLRGVTADARAFTVLRGWLPTAVRLDVADPRDPTPYWYLSTKDPAGLADALNQVRRARAPADMEGFDDGAPASQEE